MNNLYDDLQKLAIDAKQWTCSLLFNEADLPWPEEEYARQAVFGYKGLLS
jgi:hypothetical protein